MRVLPVSRKIEKGLAPAAWRSTPAVWRGSSTEQSVRSIAKGRRNIAHTPIQSPVMMRYHCRRVNVKSTTFPPDNSAHSLSCFILPILGIFWLHFWALLWPFGATAFIIETIGPTGA
jgi:hypothetical protein